MSVLITTRRLHQVNSYFLYCKTAITLTLLILTFLWYKIVRLENFDSPLICYQSFFQRITQSVLLSSTDWLKAVRATSILGFVSLLVALVVTILKLFFLKNMKPALFAVIGTAFIGGKSYMYVDEKFILALLQLLWQ